MVKLLTPATRCGYVQIMRLFYTFTLLGFALLLGAINTKASDIAGLLSAVESDNYRQAAQALEQLATLYQANYPKQAHSYAQKGLKLARRQKDAPTAVLFYLKLGQIQTQLRQLDDAESNLDEGLDYARRLRATGTEIDFLIAQANMYYADNDYLKALTTLTNALKIAQPLPNKLPYAQVLHQLGLLFYKTNQYAKAQEYLRNAANSYMSLGKNTLALQANLQLANSYLKLQNYPQAKQIFTKIAAEPSTTRPQALAGLLAIYKATNTQPKPDSLATMVASLKAKQRISDYQNLQLLAESIGLSNLALTYLKQEQALRDSLIAATKSKPAPKPNLQLTQNLQQVTKQKQQLEQQLQQQTLAAEDQQQELKALQDLQQIQEQELIRARTEARLKELENTTLRQQKEVQRLEVQKANALKYQLLGGIAFLGILATVLVYAYRQQRRTAIQLANQQDELQNAYRRLEEAANHDPLTGLTNRRRMWEVIDKERDRSLRNQQPFCLAICDIDKFKNFNDTYGHDCGDFVLKSAAKLLGRSIRRTDTLSRWGGEEFLLLLPETSLDGGRVACQSLRQTLAQTTFEFAQNKLNITMTFGVARCDKNQSPEQAIKAADEALYRGKENGRNRVETQPAPPPKVIPLNQ